MRARMAAMPGVSSVGSGDVATLTGDDEGSNITAEGGTQAQLPEELQDVDHDRRQPELFLDAGHSACCPAANSPKADGATAPKVAVVSEAMAKALFPRDEMRWVRTLRLAAETKSCPTFGLSAW